MPQNSENGKNDLKFTSKLSQTPIFYGCVSTIALFCSLLIAQDVGFEYRIDIIKTILNELDNSAKECLEQLNDSRLKNQGKCVDFMISIDGQITTDLISHCGAIRSWRENYVENANSSNETVEANQQRMRDVEYFCGENFLQKRTVNVSAAFDLLTNKRFEEFSNLSISRRISELQFINAQNKERRFLRESVMRQNQRQQSESDNRINELERELIRQQINSAPYPQN